MRFTSLLCYTLGIALLGAAVGGRLAADPQTAENAPAQVEEAPAGDLNEAVARLPARYRQWVQSIAGLITGAELEYFLGLTEDYRRDTFMERFWKPRDPAPRSANNEMRERWQELVDSAGGIDWTDPRFMLYLVNGSPNGMSLPNGQLVSRCFSRKSDLEIWFYGRSLDRRWDLPIVLQRRAPGAPWEAYVPGGVLRPIRRQGDLPTTDIRLLCADENLRLVLGEISRRSDYLVRLEEALTPPRPSPEWLSTVASSGTDLPPGAETFDASVLLTYPGRRQSRTAIQVGVEVPLDGAPGQRFDGVLFHNFLVRGEVIRDGKLFEEFSYGFEGETPAGATAIPLGFTRFLRPGPASLRLLVEDRYTGRYHHVALQLDVPSPQNLPWIQAAGGAVEAPRGPTLELLSPPGDFHTGLVRFTARSAATFDKVTFYLDDKPVLSRRRPPYTSELQLGKTPEPHRIRVVGFSGNREVATDQIWINQGAQRFRVHVVEPRAGGIYPGSLTARIEVQTPDGRPPQSVELYLNEELLVTLDDPPYSHLIRLAGAEAAVVRAVAYLEDGATAEEAVFVNAGGFAEAVEVRLVELQALVVDGDGHPVRDLGRERFQVFENGAPQVIDRFEEATEAPIHAALLIDRSASMEPHLEQVTDAAYTFASRAILSEQDRISVLSFADDATIDAGFSGSPAQVERALAGLDATGGTALYDSLAQALNSFDGIQGHTALLLFSDGRDESSRLTFAQALESARRSGVSIYVLGLREAFADKADRQEMMQLAEETGGAAYLLDDLGALDATFGLIVEELRSRYLISYQPPDGGSGTDYRRIEVKVDVRGAEVRTRRGYYP